MSILRKVTKLLNIAEAMAPRLDGCAAYRVARKQLLLEASLVETQWDGENEGAREGSLEDEKCQDPGTQEASTNALNDTLTELLQRPPRGICRSSKDATNVVSLSASKRSKDT
jgi:hypothetical protein